MALVNKPTFTQVWASGGDIVEPTDLKKQQGWTVEVPPHQYENWIQNRQDQYIAHINQRGIPVWDALTEYEAGGLSYVQGTDGKVYKSVAASGPTTVAQNPVTDATDTCWTIAFADVGAFLTQGVADGLYLAKAQNLADLPNVATARTNLGAAPLASPTFTGTPAAPTATAGTNTTQIATTAFVTAADNLKANLASPALTGTPTAPTAAVGTNTTQLATTAFVQSADKFNSAIVTLASAATVNLTTGAPNTSQITISGTTTITAFTVAVGKSYVVKFSGALTLTNNAAIVTGTGANIITAAGDSCIIRSTASNVVEVIDYVRGIPQGLGDGQSWQDVSGSRVAGTAYQNLTGRAIAVSVGLTATAGRDFEVSTNGTTWVKVGFSSGGGVYTFETEVPNNHFYRVLTAYTAGQWAELR